MSMDDIAFGSRWQSETTPTAAAVERSFFGFLFEHHQFVSCYAPGAQDAAFPVFSRVSLFIATFLIQGGLVFSMRGTTLTEWNIIIAAAVLIVFIRLILKLIINLGHNLAGAKKWVVVILGYALMIAGAVVTIGYGAYNNSNAANGEDSSRRFIISYGVGLGFELLVLSALYGSRALFEHCSSKRAAKKELEHYKIDI